MRSAVDPPLKSVDAAYEPSAGDAPFVRFGRGYSDKKRWSEKEAQTFQAALTERSDGWKAMNKTVRLFKAVWQGQELSREAVVKVLGKVLEPVGVVQAIWRCSQRCLRAGECGQTAERRCWRQVVGCMSHC